MTREISHSSLRRRERQNKTVFLARSASILRGSLIR